MNSPTHRRVLRVKAGRVLRDRKAAERTCPVSFLERRLPSLSLRCCRSHCAAARAPERSPTLSATRDQPDGTSPFGTIRELENEHPARHLRAFQLSIRQSGKRMRVVRCPRGSARRTANLKLSRRSRTAGASYRSRMACRSRPPHLHDVFAQSPDRCFQTTTSSTDVTARLELNRPRRSLGRLPQGAHLYSRFYIGPAGRRENGLHNSMARCASSPTIGWRGRGSEVPRIVKRCVSPPPPPRISVSFWARTAPP